MARDKLYLSQVWDRRKPSDAGRRRAACAKEISPNRLNLSPYPTPLRHLATIVLCWHGPITIVTAPCHVRTSQSSLAGRLDTAKEVQTGGRFGVDSGLVCSPLASRCGNFGSPSAVFLVTTLYRQIGFGCTLLRGGLTAAAFEVAAAASSGLSVPFLGSTVRAQSPDGRQFAPKGSTKRCPRTR